MTWERIDQWHMRNGEWTITKPGKPELYSMPYGLHHDQRNHGYFKTAEAAIAAHAELIARKRGKSAIPTPTNRELTHELDTE